MLIKEVSGKIKDNILIEIKYNGFNTDPDGVRINIDNGKYSAHEAVCMYISIEDLKSIIDLLQIIENNA